MEIVTCTALVITGFGCNPHDLKHDTHADYRDRALALSALTVLIVHYHYGRDILMLWGVAKILAGCVSAVDLGDGARMQAARQPLQFHD